MFNKIRVHIKLLLSIAALAFVVGLASWLHQSSNGRNLITESPTATQTVTATVQLTNTQTLLLFTLPGNTDLSTVTKELRATFQNHGITLAMQASLAPQGNYWQLNSQNVQGQPLTYLIQKNGASFAVYNPNFPLFPKLPDQPNAEIPNDAYSSDQESFRGLKPLSQNAAERHAMQRLYEIFSWQSFLALNWRTKAGRQTEPLWVSWKNAYEVFKADGSEPSDWDTPRELVTILSKKEACESLTRKDRALFHLSAVSRLTPDELRLNDTTQAFSSPLWDQNGHLVYYEVLINEDEFDFIINNDLYNLDGQIKYYNDNYQEGFNFAPGSLGYGSNETGPIELKLAWKIIDQAKGDLPERFYTKRACIFTEKGEWQANVTVGLVGMHIAHKTLSSAQWVWSTFEQVDNLSVDPHAVADALLHGQELRPSFYDPSCATCPVNVPPVAAANGLTKTQVMRVIPIAPATADLNRSIQEILKNNQSVWQYYELVGAQYATAPSITPTLANQLPGSIINKSGGMPAPVYLANSVMETYFQKGNQPAKNLEAAGATDEQIVFGTESCMGCHYTAGIANGFHEEKGCKVATFTPGSADFSWLFQMQAHWKKRCRP